MKSGKSLYNPHWYRVANLQPRLQTGLHIQRQILRDREWYLFTHPINGRHHRLNRNAYEFVGRIDGKLTIDELWNGLLPKLGDDAPSQDETLVMLAQLTEAGLILFDSLPDWPIYEEMDQKRRASTQNSALNPFAFRVRIADPSSFLLKLHNIQKLLFNPYTFVIWLAIIIFGLAATLVHWPSIRAYAAVHLLTPQCLLLAWLVYPCMKFCHELGHAFAIRHWGGSVKECGVTFFLLVPAPYVDASSAISFPCKWARVLVSAAGIMVELLIASVALFIWLITDNSMLRDAVFAAMSIGGVSTIMFNGNPLMRFDGYYILCDLLELPNLAPRSQRLWSFIGQRYLLQNKDASPPQMVSGEKFWLLLYSPLSWIYRIVVSLFIIKWIAAKSALLGLIAIGWMAFSLIAVPLWKILAALSTPRLPSQKRGKSFIAITAIVFILVIGVFQVPLPSSTTTEGLIWMPEQAQIRIPNDGQIVEIIAKDGRYVERGTPLIVLTDLVMIAEKKRLEAKIDAAQSTQLGNLLTQATVSRNAGHEIESLKNDLVDISDRIDKMTLRAEADGIFVLPEGNNLIDRNIAKGTLIGYIVARDSTTVRAVISNNDEGRIRAGVKSVSVWLAEEKNDAFNGQLLRSTPAATKQLPSTALGDKGGGEFITDPADKEGINTLEPVFVMDIQLPNRKTERIGGRAWVRFEHESKPLAQTAVWYTRQLFLKLFPTEG